MFCRIISHVQYVSNGEFINGHGERAGFLLNEALWLDSSAYSSFKNFEI